MSRNKKVFLIFAVVFFMLLFYASYDISKRTTFPGSKPQLKERLQKDNQKPDSILKKSLYDKSPDTLDADLKYKK